MLLRSTVLLSSSNMCILLFPIMQTSCIFRMCEHIELFTGCLICTSPYISTRLSTQLSVDFSSSDGTLALRARAAEPGADPLNCIFSGVRVEALKDLRWHKVSLSVQNGAASLQVDCDSIETKPLESRGVIPTDGHTMLGIRASDAGPVQVRSRRNFDIRVNSVFDSICRFSLSCTEEVLIKVKGELRFFISGPISWRFWLLPVS